MVRAQENRARSPVLMRPLELALPVTRTRPERLLPLFLKRPNTSCEQGQLLRGDWFFQRIEEWYRYPVVQCSWVYDLY